MLGTNGSSNEQVFPNNFTWGAATAAYQIEGAATTDGRGLSVWDMFCRKPGAVWNGQSGEIACDHYHRYQDDVGLMKSLGLQAYRFSISWPRVLPAGTSMVNERGLDFYDRLVDALLTADITPYVTLFHWDFPYELYCRGGWLSPDSPDWFAEYANLVVNRLSDRVKHWITVNEPQVFLNLGHREGTHAPGDRLDLPEVLRATHHVLLAHGKAVQAIRAAARTPVQVGFAPVGFAAIPASERSEDIEAARQGMFSITTPSLWNTTWYADPIFRQTYPEDGLAVFGRSVPAIGPNDMATIGQPLDFYGINVYQGVMVRADANGQPEVAPFPVGHPLTAFHWPVVPEALYWGTRFLWERYGVPIYITENGLANTDWVALDGHVHDPQRIDFTARYLQALGRAIADGVDARGYFHWSLMDNFEWAEGYKQRFGMIYVDYETQQRIPKDSALWYKQVIATNTVGVGH